MMNRKIANATQITVNNIKFHSKLEAKCYTLLKEAGLNFGYEQFVIELLPKFRTNFIKYEVIYGKLSNQLTDKGISHIIRSITYKPDFVYCNNVNLFIIIETKGYMNDVYPYKKKLLFQFLNNYQEKTGQKVYFFEPTNITTIKQTIEIIKQILSQSI
jgi:hypothetical protein